MTLNLKKLFVVFLLIIMVFMASCAKENNNGDDNKKDENTENSVDNNSENTNTDDKEKIEIVLEKSNYTIMTGTTLETTVYVFKSNVEGPTVFITGGTHGDELAGWHTALKLLERDDFRGTVIIIPRLNRLACEREERYPKTTDENGVKYTDLNRSFPGKEDGTMTQRLAYAIQEEILKYNPKYVIDLHESLKSYASGGSRLGDQLLYGNARSALLCEEIIEIYNTKYLAAGDVPFMLDGPGVEHSLNYWVGTVQNKIEFTVETNRQLTLDKRIEQQTNVLNAFFEYIWE